MVSFKSNRLQTIHPQALGPQMRWLILTDNCLESIPAEIGQCTKLQKLMLAGNRIQSLPASISRCTNLELVRLASNCLVSVSHNSKQLSLFIKDTGKCTGRQGMIGEGGDSSRVV